jgi:hypothetical protein
MWPPHGTHKHEVTTLFVSSNQLGEEYVLIRVILCQQCLNESFTVSPPVISRVLGVWTEMAATPRCALSLIPHITEKLGC